MQRRVCPLARGLDIRGHPNKSDIKSHRSKSEPENFEDCADLATVVYFCHG